MGYEYEVFFSYKRDLESDAWHLVVMEKMKFWLRQELSQLDVAIFFDTEEIHTGARWRHKIYNALRVSKTMVCVWSPLYFQSKWCVSEWKTFAKRELHCGRDLIIPASYHDGNYFPSEARAKQILDFSEYTSTAPRYWQTETAVEFERRRLKPFVRDLAELIRMAPDFDPNFPVVEVPSDQISQAPAIKRIADDD